jgi:hypothetical protein
MHPQSVGYPKYSIFPGENKQIGDSMPSYAVQIIALCGSRSTFSRLRRLVARLEYDLDADCNLTR